MSLQARSDLKLSVSHNIASKASKLGFTHDRKVGGKKSTLKVRRPDQPCCVSCCICGMLCDRCVLEQTQT
jgi:hypothetical protein